MRIRDYVETPPTKYQTLNLWCRSSVLIPEKLTPILLCRHCQPVNLLRCERTAMERSRDLQALRYLPKNSLSAPHLGIKQCATLRSILKQYTTVLRSFPGSAKALTQTRLPSLCPAAPRLSAGSVLLPRLPTGSLGCPRSVPKRSR